MNHRCLTRLSVLTAVTSVVFWQPCRCEEITAFTEPYREIDVAAPEMGTIAEIEIQEGDIVATDQNLASLNQQVLKASLKVAKANMEAKGKLNSTLAELQMQSRRLQKILGLRERNHASQQEVERAELQKEIATAQVEAARDERKVKKHEFERIRAQLEMRRIKSPIDGIVTVIYKDVGEFVSATDATVAKVVQLEPLKVVFSVPLARAELIRVDHSIDVLVGDRPTPHVGVVEFVSPTADAQSGTTRVKVRLPNPGQSIKSGEACRLVLSADDVAKTKQVSKNKGKNRRKVK